MTNWQASAVPNTSPWSRSHRTVPCPILKGQIDGLTWSRRKLTSAPPICREESEYVASRRLTGANAP